MSIAIQMPALSPTMEVGKLAKWHVKVGDEVAAGDILAEIETDKATMEFETVDEGTILSLDVAEGTEGVAVGTVIARLSGEDGDEGEDGAQGSEPAAQPAMADASAAKPEATKPAPTETTTVRDENVMENRVIASPLARRLASEKGVDLASVTGTGPNGRIVKADVETAQPGAVSAVKGVPDAQPTALPAASTEKPASVSMADETRAQLDDRIPHSVVKLSGMRKTIARRLSQSMQQAPHIYLTVDIRLDKLLALRGELNEVLAKRGVKLSVNDMLIKALGLALMEVPACNVSFAGNEMIQYARADISVAVSIPGGLITPIVQNANGRSLAAIATDMNDLASRAKDGKLLPTEYQGGTASLSNMGMMGIKQFTAVINPPQATILAIGAGEKRPWVMPDGTLGVATVMSATGSFDHRAVDGADGARLMAVFRELVENPLGLVS
ncbi:MAG: pyruvate dehydrogenase complex dihydrolipoamide acetyltransferase [Novosphingobium sp.]